MRDGGSPRHSPRPSSTGWPSPSVGTSVVRSVEPTPTATPASSFAAAARPASVVMLPSLTTSLLASESGDLEDDLDVVRASLEGLRVVLERHGSADQPVQPGRVGAGQGLRGGLPVTPVRVHGAEDEVVLEHELAVE